MELMRTPSNEPIKKGTFAMWEGDYKLIYYLDYNKVKLFNLRSDPDELINLTDSEPEISRRMLGIMKDNLDRANEKIKSTGKR